MSRVRLNHLMTSTAVAVVGFALLVGSSAVYAQSPADANSDAKIDSLVPMPDTSLVPPPTAADVAPKADAAPMAAEQPAAMEQKAPEPAAAAAPAPAAPVVAAPAPAPVDPVAEKLRDMAGGKYDRLLGGKKERAGVEAFYASRDYAPLWLTDSALNARGKAAIAFLGGVAADGLDPSDYPTPDFTAAREPDALAEAELRLTNAVLTFARHAQIGRVHFSRVSADINYDLQAPDAADVLKTIASADETAKALDGYNPQHPGYKALKAKLAEARKQAGGDGPVQIPHGATLKTGKLLVTDSRVPALRKRLGLEQGSDNTYDKELEDAVARFQKSNNLKPNGELTGATVNAMNGAERRERDEDIILVNMERWRWLPHDLGKTYVMVNIPDYTLRVMKNGQQYWKTKIVVGKPNLPTPLISAEMKFITVNPTWNVPPSIIEKEYLPALMEDPGAMDRIGLKVEQNRDGTIRIYQPPGDRNALGRIRFNFPNKFLVYQHDTPDKHLFAQEKRAYSHGCMRVQDPLKYAEVILSLVLPNEGYTQDRLHKMFGGNEVNINFPHNIPVHLTYQTAFVDEDGKLQLRADVYGRDARMLQLLKGSERKVADVAIERAPSSSSKPVRMAPGTFGGGDGYRGGGNFFEWLFGGPRGSSPTVRRPSGRISAR